MLKVNLMQCDVLSNKGGQAAMQKNAGAKAGE
jgi:hypothetical protein